MSLTTQQKVDLLYKKLFNKATSDVDRQHFEEALSRDIVIPSQIWLQHPDSTDPAAIGNQVTLLTQEPFTHVPGTESAYVLGHTNIVPFNYGTSGNGLLEAPTGYVYVLLDDSLNQIPFGTNDWYLDPSSGILIFFGGNPAGVSDSTPPRITCYKYTGAVGGNGLALPTQLQFDSGDLTANVLTWNHNLGYTGLMPAVTNNTGIRVEPTNVSDSDANTMLIDLSGFTVSGTWTASLSL